MKKQDKRPIAYAPREIISYGDGNIAYVVGYFVSKAYVGEVEKMYYKNGAINSTYFIEFVGGRETTYQMHDFQKEVLGNNGEFYVEDENANYERKWHVFNSYKACKKYVCELNAEHANNLRNRINEYGITDSLKLWINLHKQAVKYGKKLEETYITEQERGRSSENTNNF